MLVITRGYTSTMEHMGTITPTDFSFPLWISPFAEEMRLGDPEGMNHGLGPWDGPGRAGGVTKTHGKIRWFRTFLQTWDYGKP